MPSKIQAVIFNKKYWTTDKARRWLKKNKLKNIAKCRQTSNYYRYRITNPRKYKHFVTKKINKDKIDLIIGFY